NITNAVNASRRSLVDPDRIHGGDGRAGAACFVRAGWLIPLPAVLPRRGATAMHPVVVEAIIDVGPTGSSRPVDSGNVMGGIVNHALKRFATGRRWAVQHRHRGHISLSIQPRGPDPGDPIVPLGVPFV